jgi:hypothetical protein
MSLPNTRNAQITAVVNRYEYLIGEAVLRHAGARLPHEQRTRFYALDRLRSRYRRTINRLLLKEKS